jgi:hypothetical protein
MVRWKVGGGLPEWKTLALGAGGRALGRYPIDWRQRSGEVPIGTG